MTTNVWLEQVLELSTDSCSTVTTHLDAPSLSQRRQLYRSGASTVAAPEILTQTDGTEVWKGVSPPSIGGGIDPSVKILFTY